MPTLKNHPSEETIELYALGRLAEKLVPPLEEHLLVCERCQDASGKKIVFFRVLRRYPSASGEGLAECSI